MSIFYLGTFNSKLTAAKFFFACFAPLQSDGGVMASIPPPPPPQIPKVEKIFPESCYERTQVDELKVREEIRQYFDREAGEGKSFIAIYSHVEPILQHGPLCGIVALAMAGPLLNEKEINPDEILCQARKEGYSRKGEMFSAHAMSQLATQVFPNSQVILLDTTEPTTNAQIISNLLEGNALLMPYDADFNHSPTLNQNGHSAHWAILHGIAISVDDDDELTSILSPINLTSEQVKGTVLKPQEIDGEVEIRLKDYLHMKKSQLLVICHQGKSKRAGIWKLKDLLKSNENLIEISPKLLQAASSVQHDQEEEESLIFFNMTEFLRCKVIVLRKNKGK